jgi:hypothetical protein
MTDDVGTVNTAQESADFSADFSRRSPRSFGHFSLFLKRFPNPYSGPHRAPDKMNARHRIPVWNSKAAIRAIIEGESVHTCTVFAPSSVRGKFHKGIFSVSFRCSNPGERPSPFSDITLLTTSVAPAPPPSLPSSPRRHPPLLCSTRRLSY